MSFRVCDGGRRVFERVAELATRLGEVTIDCVRISHLAHPSLRSVSTVLLTSLRSAYCPAGQMSLRAVLV